MGRSVSRRMLRILDRTHAPAESRAASTMDSSACSRRLDGKVHSLGDASSAERHKIYGELGKLTHAMQ